MHAGMLSSHYGLPEFAAPPCPACGSANVFTALAPPEPLGAPTPVDPYLLAGSTPALM